MFAVLMFLQIKYSKCLNYMIAISIVLLSHNSGHIFVESQYIWRDLRSIFSDLREDKDIIYSF